MTHSSGEGVSTRRRGSPESLGRGTCHVHYIEEQTDESTEKRAGPDASWVKLCMESGVVACGWDSSVGLG